MRASADVRVRGQAAWRWLTLCMTCDHQVEVLPIPRALRVVCSLRDVLDQRLQAIAGLNWQSRQQQPKVPWMWCT